MKIVSLFDGIGCGHVALNRLGFTVEQYAAFEIDRYAKSISSYNHPHISHYGDVLNANFQKFRNFDLVMGGSPCTFWSIAKMNREVDKAGIGWLLFMRFVDAVKQIQPRYFLYENVSSMPNSIRDYISEEFGMEPVKINSALVSAQQRKRLYWTNIKGITQPVDRGILLQDILEIDKLSNIRKPIALAEKAQTIPATIYKENALSMLMRGKTGLFCAQPVAAVQRTREIEVEQFGRLEIWDNGKTNALTNALMDKCICEPVRIGFVGKGGQGNRIYSVRGKSICLSASSGGKGSRTGLYKIDLPDGDYIVRKLTPVEAERCQTLPDNYTAFGRNEKGLIVPISNTQRYKSIGNGWTADVISHILSFMDSGYKGELIA